MPLDVEDLEANLASCHAILHVVHHLLVCRDLMEMYHVLGAPSLHQRLFQDGLLHLLELLQVKCLIAQRTEKFLSRPLLDTFCVKVMPLVAG